MFADFLTAVPFALALLALLLLDAFSFEESVASVASGASAFSSSTEEIRGLAHHKYHNTS